MSIQPQERIDNATKLLDNSTFQTINTSTSNNTIYIYSSFDSSDNFINHYYLVRSYSENITIIILTLQMVIGIIGNIVSLIVWTKGKECCRLACSTYFQLLAVSDIFALICARWSYDVHINESASSVGECVFSYFLVYFPPQLSTWLVVCISYERLFSLVFPFSFLPSGAKCRSKIAFAVLLFVLAAVNGYAFRACFGYRYSDWSLWFKVSSVWTLAVIPFISIVTSNLLILVQMCCMNRNSNVVSRERHSKRVSVFTKLTISSSLLLLISVFPSVMVRIDFFIDLFDMRGMNSIIFSALAWSTLYANNCFNFLVYCFSSPTFRSDIKHFTLNIKSRFRNDTTLTVTTEL